MSCDYGFDKHIKAHYNMNVVNQNKCQKSWGQGNEIIKKQREKHMSNQDYARYIFWIVIVAILMSTLSGN
jgi:hypothetical protein